MHMNREIISIIRIIIIISVVAEAVIIVVMLCVFVEVTQTVRG
jgi:hypothetical protein